jgi:hypothetical protein
LVGVVAVVVAAADALPAALCTVAAAVIAGAGVMNQSGDGVCEVLAGVVAEFIFEPGEQAGRHD